MKVYPSYSDYRHMAKRFNLIPVWARIMGDLDTPVSALQKLYGDSENTYLLESVEGGEHLGRYSFTGSRPFLVFRSTGGLVETIGPTGSVQRSVDDPFAYLSQLFTGFNAYCDQRLPRFWGGAVGFIGYDTVRFFENLPGIPKPRLPVPDIYLVFPGEVVIFDHVRNQIILTVITHPQEEHKGYRYACKRLENMAEDLYRAVPLATPVYRQQITGSTVAPEFTSTTDRAAFEKTVTKAKQYIRSGDIFQVVLSQRLQTRFSASPLRLYRLLRSINPSPYMFYLNYSGTKIIGSSPEVMVSMENGMARLRPIAGTRRRGETPGEDEHLARELLSDPKERAEHIMLVDLGRNDLGRVCEYGTVEVTDLMRVERYSHVMHIVSDISGTVHKGKNAFDVFRACFPAGTVSGAPKIRAMQIIDELEPVARGPYAGAVGYFGFDGNMDTCIAIRTIVIRDDTAYIQAGAGIVADSDPGREYEETLNKAKALVKTVQEG